MSAPLEQHMRRLGVGGMAEVFLTRREGPGGLSKLMVIKRILPHAREDQRFVQMFLDEARLAAGLNHPNIVQIYDVYGDESNLSIGMEYLRGETLRAIIKTARSQKTRVPLNIAMRVLMDVASALRCAHEARDAEGEPLGLIHRDVTLANVIVGYDGVTKLLDFGIAKASSQSTRTLPGQIKGKYAYCSPEQVRSHDIDSRADLFSLGIIMFELLAQRRLFKRDQPMETLRAVMDAPIPSLAKYNPHAPAELNALMLKLLIRDRNSRVQSAVEFLREMESILNAHQLFCSAQEAGDWLAGLMSDQRQRRAALEGEVLGAQAHPGVPHLGAVEARGRPQERSIEASETGHIQRPRAGWALTLVILGLGVALGGVGLWLYARHLERQRAAPPTPSTTTLLPAPQRVTLRLFVKPEGATLTVNGDLRGDLVGPEGASVSAEPRSIVKILVERVGHLRHEVELTAPPEGTEEIFINLAPIHAASDAGPSTDAGASEDAGVSKDAAPPEAKDAAPPEAKDAAVEPARMLIIYTPTRGKLSIDNTPHEGRSPHRIGGLAPGWHRIKVEAKGFQTLERAVKLKPGKRRKVSYTLKRE